ncbi:hypothetical protein bsdtw1_02052 [Clostridium fungisolvens]|uniref:Uncharacterized protein n=1 Tax=Clostridium fungisolvens TaxID=1604897 RepID=A0A6V8SFG5_9CLOT|nr:hypothetical protein bsdtw1_02052 [Clostridium fungisolvens]
MKKRTRKIIMNIIMAIIITSFLIGLFYQFVGR